MKINFKELSYYKNVARQLGNRNEIVETIPVCYSYEHISKIAVMGILGRLQRMLQIKKVHFFIESNWLNDINGKCDFVINANPVQVESKYSYQNLINYEDCSIEFDESGISNLNTILAYVGKCFKIDDHVAKDVNALWDKYMRHYGIVE